jgi:hypothetical protein
MEELFKQFTREKQFLLNVSPSTLEGYKWAWKAFAPALAKDVLQRIEELRPRGLPLRLIRGSASIKDISRPPRRDASVEGLLSRLFLTSVN